MILILNDGMCNACVKHRITVNTSLVKTDTINNSSMNNFDDTIALKKIFETTFPKQLLIDPGSKKKYVTQEICYLDQS